LGHNVAKFDNDVAEVHLGLRPPSWDRVHDTMFSLFLRDPHANSLSLKPSAERFLKEPPAERDAVFDWLADHGIIKRSKRKGVVTYQKDAGAFICRAPGNVVAPYAMGDVTRAQGLHALLHPYVVENGMQAAYDRERRLAPILLDNERHGMRVDLPALEKSLAIYEKALKKIETWLRKKLRSPGLDFEHDDDVAAALKKSGIVTKFPKTPTGLDSVSKKNLTADYFSDRNVWVGLYYRNALWTVLTMSMRKWYAEGSRTGGYIYTSWNQVRQSHGVEKIKGARSGRITCSYFQNITKDFTDRGDGYEHPTFLELPPLPLVRDFLLPDEGDLFIHRDYNQQEMRLVAHYEDGALCDAYCRDAATDVHTFVQSEIQRVVGKLYERRPVKIVNFRTVYGGGIAGLAEGMKWKYEEAKELIDAWKKALPDVVSLDRELKSRFRDGLPLRTYGGRLYHVKPPAIAKKGPRKGQMISYEYTALNYLIQPSGADVTKEAIIRYHDHPKKKGRMLVTVHDEINLSAPAGIAEQEAAVLKECMESIELLVPWRTDGDLRTAWGKKPQKKEKAA
jgi:DNA polymerase I-like protein with 3'-5' exonuclease and polymerase domains